MTINNRKTHTTLQACSLDKIKVLYSPELVYSGRTHLATEEIPVRTTVPGISSGFIRVPGMWQTLNKCLLKEEFFLSEVRNLPPLSDTPTQECTRTPRALL